MHADAASGHAVTAAEKLRVAVTGQAARRKRRWRRSVPRLGLHVRFSEPVRWYRSEAAVASCLIHFPALPLTPCPFALPAAPRSTSGRSTVFFIMSYAPEPRAAAKMRTSPRSDATKQRTWGTDSLVAPARRAASGERAHCTQNESAMLAATTWQPAAYAAVGEKARRATGRLTRSSAFVSRSRPATRVHAKPTVRALNVRSLVFCCHLGPIYLVRHLLDQQGELTHPFGGSLRLPTRPMESVPRGRPSVRLRRQFL